MFGKEPCLLFLSSNAQDFIEEGSDHTLCGP